MSQPPEPELVKAPVHPSADLSRWADIGSAERQGGKRHAAGRQPN